MSTVEDRTATAAEQVDAPRTPSRASRRSSRWPVIRGACQVAIACAFIAAWELLPRIDALSSQFKFLNAFFISSPSEVADWLGRLLLGLNDSTVSAWPYLWLTVYSTVLGVVIGLVLGALAGLIFSNAPRAAEVVRPFVVLANSIPRVAVIPIFVVMLGPTAQASILSIVTVVFFLGFFNAFEGGISIPRPVIDNAKLLGASQWSQMRYIRLPRVLSWTFAALPNAISFGLIVAVTTELLAGVRGMGELLQTSMLNANSGLTFAVIAILSVVGLLMHGCGVLIRNRLLRWERTD